MQEENYYFSKAFKYQNGFLFCENVSVGEIKVWLKNQGIARVTPAFVYSKSQIEENVLSYQNALSALKRNTQLNYALKANFNPSLVRIIKSLGCSLTLVSGFELELSLKLGFQPENIVLNGNGKELWEIELAVRNGCLLNIDGMFNATQTTSVCRKLQKKARILLRINPNIDPMVHKYNSTGIGGSKFGIQKEDLNDVLREIESEPLLQLVGIHCHLGSTITDIGIFRECTEMMSQLFSNLKNEGFEHMKYINLGGGLGIDYTKHIAMTTDPETINGMETKPLVIPTPADVVKVIDEVLGDKDISLILEPGRSLIANAGILLTSVLGVKKSEPKRYIVVDGSMTEVIRPALYSAYHHVDICEPSQVEDAHKMLYDVVGPVCESGDFLGKDRYLTTPHEGCTLAVFDAGAYCSSMGSNYNMRARPAEVLVNGNKLELIRRPDSLDDILGPYNV
ncbi:uncharacterized protein LOC132725567 [Ruditapes philippinarum]|uniref:uncharacterized protein LOC132725567 n=1 Tax=Ruditapes philippinarum TaxID=129788 RepID=UPI00295C3763|nr:uncharacterized protein LOC132725567 [Ruditapes philippinarum]